MARLPIVIVPNQVLKAKAKPVEKVDDEEFVHVRSANQRLLRLSLEVLRLELLDEADGHRRYRSRAKAAGRR